MQKLYKVVTMALMGMVIFSMTTCKKDGVFNPSKKVSKIYEQSGTNPKTLSETWSWDKGKLIRVDAVGGDYYTFEYDKNRLSKITTSDGHQEFTYDGSKLNKIIAYVGAKEYATYNIEHDGRNISKVRVEYASTSSIQSAKSLVSAAMRFVLPIELPDEIALPTQKSQKGTGTVVYTYTYKWDGNNVVEMVRDDNSNNKTTVTYTYDKNSNPLYGLFTSTSVTMLSKNNIATLRGTINYASGLVGNYEYEYSYIYKGGFPTTKNIIYRSGSSTSTSAAYYEYE
jgi:hypothetical protein